MDNKIVLLFFFIIIFFFPFNIGRKIKQDFLSPEINVYISKLNEYKKYDINKYNKFDKNLQKLNKYIKLISNESNKSIADESIYNNINKATLLLRNMINQLHEISYSIEGNKEFKRFNYIIKEIYNYYYTILYKYIENYNQKLYNNPSNNISPIYTNAPSIDLINKGDYTVFNNEQPYNSFSNYLIY